MGGQLNVSGGFTQSTFAQAVINGDAYRVSKRLTTADSEEYIVHFDPASVDDVLYIATPAVDPDADARIDVYENADPGTNLVDDMQVHNMRYDVSADQETPEATIQRVSDGGLDTTGAEKTEETQIAKGNEFQAPADAPERAIWRIISGDETVSMVITDESNGSGNRFAFDTVMYEGPTLPED